MAYAADRFSQQLNARFFKADEIGFHVPPNWHPGLRESLVVAILASNKELYRHHQFQRLCFDAVGHCRQWLSPLDQPQHFFVQCLMA